MKVKKEGKSMPIYEYQCTKCGERFELRRSIGDNDSEIKCPKCGTESPRRVFSVFTRGVLWWGIWPKLSHLRPEPEAVCLT